MASKSLSDTATESGPLLSAREEAARFAKAADVFLERVKHDPRIVKRFLRAVDYDGIMAAEKLAQSAPAGLSANGTSSVKAKREK